MSDAIGRFLEDQYGMTRNRLGDFSATSPMNRESTNVEDRRGETFSKFDSFMNEVNDVVPRIQRGFKILTTPKVNYEQWLADMQAIGDLLPKEEIAPVPGTVAHSVPFMKRGASLRAEGGRVNRSPEDRHADQAWLDEEARQNYAANPAPVEWGVMPSVAGPFGDALASFLQSAPSLPFSSMPQDHQRRALQTAATLLMMGESPISEMFAQGKADGGATLSEGPEPTGRDKVFDAVYGWLGGKPENRWAADKITDVATLGGMAPWTGAYDGAKELAQTGRPAALATAVIPGARVAAPVAKAAEKAVEKGIRAFHGSPHDFDRFDISKIGTGEGAQAYGHGLYMAENEAVARGYRDALSPTRPAWGLAKEGRYFPADGASYWGVQRLNEKLAGQLPYGSTDVLPHDAIVRALDDVKADASGIKGPNGEKLRRELATVEAVIKSNPDLTFMRQPSTGRMYEVNIKANPEDFLDWDKPLSQQPKAAQAIGRLNLPPEAVDDLGGDLSVLRNAERPQDAYDTLASLSGIGDVSGASRLLREAGIPGIRYLDQGSRGAGEGSRNYVVFDDAIIDIVRKYGIAGLLAAIYGGSSDAEASIPNK